jgi:LL-diaminopimelate aminotransferase
MEIRPSRRMTLLKGYPFAEVDRMVADLRGRGIPVIDFGVGDPTDPTPAVVRDEVKRAVDARASAGYPSYVGSGEFRAAVSAWYGRRFGVTLDPDTEICANIGAKEAVFNFPHALIDPGDVVLCPSPGYPPYNRGTLFAGGTPWFYPVSMDHGFLPDLAAIPDEIVRRAKLLWINYPNSPSGRAAPDSLWGSVLDFAASRGIVVASDEAYSEIWYDRPPRSALEFGRDGLVVFQSLSKRSNMTGYRVGWVCGDRRIVDLFRRLKTNVDSGTPTLLQDAAVAALSDETHVAAMRATYRERRDVLVPALRAIGCEVPVPDATIYVWPKAPAGMNGLEFARRLLSPDIAVATTPGGALGELLADGTNPGENHVRFALVPSLTEVRDAAERIRRGFGAS